MTMTQRQRLRVAGAIRIHLLGLERLRRRTMQSKLQAVTEQIQRIESLRRKLGLCEAMGLPAAAGKLLDQLPAAARDVPYCLQEAERAVQACKVKAPAMAEIHRDLLQIEEEFGELRHDPEGDVLAVTTDAIQLEDVYLGEFEIALHLPSLAEMRHGHIFRVVALDPHPAASNDCVTHPHVSDEQMCTGDAGASINAALREGRICDFFLLARSVLTTYNAASPYVSLDNWHGRGCYDCGYVMNPDEMSWCGSCERDFCDECVSSCCCCGETRCGGCLETCEGCGESVCGSCRIECPECGRRLCKSCLDEDSCPCAQDREEDDEQSREEDPEDPEASPRGTEAA